MQFVNVSDGGEEAAAAEAFFAAELLGDHDASAAAATSPELSGAVLRRGEAARAWEGVWPSADAAIDTGIDAGVDAEAAPRADAAAADASAGGAAATARPPAAAELADRGFVPLSVKGGDLVVIAGTLDHLSLRNRSPRARHTFQLHLVEGPEAGVEWADENWLQLPQGRAFPRL